MISNPEGKILTQYIILQENIEDIYVNKKVGITFKGRYGLVTLDENNTLQEIYIGNGYHLSHHQKTLKADATSHSAYMEM